MKQLTEEEQAEIGEKWAKILYLKKYKDENGKPRPGWYVMREYGGKTALGVFRTICRMVDEARGEKNNGE